MTVVVMLCSVLFCNVECVLWTDRLWAMVHWSLQCCMYDTRR